ncbi:MAG: hypothetical protein H7124_04210 [Phycisphaerales bacterium]|nr:hypothetical protein [Hyphomonadaceae bacterium]
MTHASLIVVGTGIGLAGQITIEALNAIKEAEIVFSLMGDPLVDAWLQTLNANIEPLEPLYEQAGSRPRAYLAMVEKILAALHAGKRVCAAFYGHPGIFVTPSHEAIRRARALGFSAIMLPGVSAEDALAADLGVDPGAWGMQTYEARDFFINQRPVDACAALVLWQIGVLGDGAFTEFQSRPAALKALACVLEESYPSDHEVVVYVAATLPTNPARIERIALHDLYRARVDQASTLYVPPLYRPQPSSARILLLERFLHDELEGVTP